VVRAIVEVVISIGVNLILWIPYLMTPNNISDEGTGRHQQHKNKAKNKYDKNPYKIIQQQLKHRKEKTNKPKDNQENKICDFKGKAPRKKAMKSIMTVLTTYNGSNNTKVKAPE
ncbi:21180_t:CDS:2, partial [Gigaspora rosea]